MINQASDVLGIFFYDFLQNSLQKSFQSIFSCFYNFTKTKIMSFECPKSIKNNEKRILGMPDAWSTSRLSHQPREPAYIIVDCRFSNVLVVDCTDTE